MKQYKFDEELFNQQAVAFLNGDTSNQEAVYKKCAEICNLAAYKAGLHDKEDISDTLIESFISVFKSVESYDRTKSFFGWFYRICYNAAIDQQRRKKDEKLVYAEPEQDEDAFYGYKSYASAESVCLRRQLWNDLRGRLSEKRFMANLYFYSGHTIKETADHFHVPVSTANNWINRDRKILQKAGYTYGDFCEEMEIAG